MADFRDYQPLMFAVYNALSKQRTSAKYFQIRASGCERFDLTMRAGKIRDMQFSSNLRVFRLAAEKKSSWRSATDVGTDFSFLTQWEKTSSQLLAQASNSADPRPPFVEMPHVETMPPGLPQYDPEVAALCSAVIFHRMFQTLSPILEKGFLVDYKTRWQHGASHWNDAPMTFAWTDANGFCFEPQTLVDERFCIYHPDHPRLKRHFCYSSWRLNETASLTRFTDALRVAGTAPFFSWNRKNYDRIVFMPSAVIDILKFCLDVMMNKLSAVPMLPPELVIVDDPLDPLFGRRICVDNRGMPVSARDIVKDGKPWNDTKNARHSGEHDAPSIFCPILKSAQSTDAVDLSPESLSATLDNRTLFIEKIRMFAPDGQGARYLVPDGGILYREGRCLGHVVPAPDSFSLEETLSHSRPVGLPIRIGNAAVCALEYTP
ncbi:MAG: hypothetical protein IJU23_15255 [Proteobacteria bacterium]|nr:hypothetical protein [Pseudomonadota bacterium]